MRDLFAYSNILGIVTIPVLSASVYLSTMSTVYNVSWPSTSRKIIPAILIFLLIMSGYFNFISTPIAPLAYVYWVFILALEFAPIIATNIKISMTIIYTAIEHNRVNKVSEKIPTWHYYCAIFLHEYVPCYWYIHYHSLDTWQDK